MASRPKVTIVVIAALAVALSGVLVYRFTVSSSLSAVSGSYDISSMTQMAKSGSSNENLKVELVSDPGKLVASQ